MALNLESQAMDLFGSMLRQSMEDMLDDQIARDHAQPEFFGGFDQAKYDQKRQELREARQKLTEGGKVCEATGQHVWGEITAFGGFCDHCGADGISREEDGAGWVDCSNCNGLGYTPTFYVRRCERCGYRDTRST